MSYWRTFLGIYVPVYNGAERLATELDIPVVFAKIKRVKRGYYQAEFKLLTANPKALKKKKAPLPLPIDRSLLATRFSRDVKP